MKAINKGTRLPIVTIREQSTRVTPVRPDSFGRKPDGRLEDGKPDPDRKHAARFTRSVAYVDVSGTACEADGVALVGDGAPEGDDHGARRRLVLEQIDAVHDAAETYFRAIEGLPAYLEGTVDTDRIRNAMETETLAVQNEYEGLRAALKQGPRPATATGPEAPGEAGDSETRGTVVLPERWRTWLIARRRGKLTGRELRAAEEVRQSLEDRGWDVIGATEEVTPAVPAAPEEISDEMPCRTYTVRRREHPLVRLEGPAKAASGEATAANGGLRTPAEHDAETSPLGYGRHTSIGVVIPPDDPAHDGLQKRLENAHESLWYGPESSDVETHGRLAALRAEERTELGLDETNVHAVVEWYAWDTENGDGASSLQVLTKREYRQIRAETLSAVIRDVTAAEERRRNGESGEELEAAARRLRAVTAKVAK